MNSINGKIIDSANRFVLVFIRLAEHGIDARRSMRESVLIHDIHDIFGIYVCYIRTFIEFNLRETLFLFGIHSNRIGIYTLHIYQQGVIIFARFNK